MRLQKLTMDAAAEQHAHHKHIDKGKRLNFRTPLLFKGGVQNKNKYEKAQLDHTSKQYTRGQLSTFNTVSMRCRTEQPRTHACMHARTDGQ